ncbi:hypothetical protein PMAYCL1PPCAC_03543, partial [Pristionchus mayeri]
FSLSSLSMRGSFIFLLVIQHAFAATCFLEETSTTPYVTMSVTIEQSLQWCHTACADTPGCISVVYDESNGSCVKQTDSPVLSPATCHAPYTRNYMSDVGCPYGDPMAAMGTDPCCRLMPFVLEYNSTKVCPQRKCDSTGGPPIIVRYRDAVTGELKTADNANRNQLTYDDTTKLWKIHYKDGWGEWTVYASAIACAEVKDPSACPCEPIIVYGEPNLNPKGPILTETTPACPYPYYPKVIVRNAKTNTRTLEDPNTFMLICMGGSWMACGNASSTYTATKIAGCGTPP